MSSRKQIQAVFFSVLMVMSVVAMGAGGAAAQPLAANSNAEELDSIHESIDTEISPQLETAEGETTLLLSVDRQIDLESTSQVSGETLQSDSEITLSPVADRVEQFEAAEVTNRYWVGNVLAIEADLSTHSIEDFAGIPGVTSIAANVEAEHPSQPSLDAASSSDTQVTTEQHQGDYTYGLEQIDVPGFEQQFNASGEGSSVVVIDDGISNPDEGHPDLEFATEAVATDGEITTGTLGSPGSHGEHVSGTVAGAAHPAGDVPRYGVAPNTSLTNINAFEEGAFLNDLLASVQFAVENDADVASMSLGFPSPDDRSTINNMVAEQMQEANEAGTVVVVSAGNAGSQANPDESAPVSSPSAEFNAFSVGASVEDTPFAQNFAGSQGDIAFFSSGAVINERDVVDPTGSTFDYPDTYPREYVKPDVSAPGLFVLSAGPLGPTDRSSQNVTYSEASGTSMAAPHVTGAIALVQSATEEDLGPDELQSALVETAEKPVNNFTELNSRDIRYGTGIINVTAATMAASSENLEISGTVTDSDDDPIVGATIESDEGALTTSNATGAYTLQSTSSATNVTADAFGYAAETVFVNESGTADFQLNDSLELDLIQGQPDRVETGGSFDIVVDAGSLDSLAVDLSNESTFRVSENDLTLLLNGEEIPFGEAYEFEDRFTGTATLTVEVDNDADISSGDELILNHTFAGAGDEAEVTTGPTEIIDTTGAADSVEIDADIVGTVNDQPTTTVTATGLVSDGEPSDGQKVTFTIGGEPVATAQTDDGTATAEVKAESIDLEPEENVTVDIEEFDVADTDEVNLVHETADLEEGFNLLSVPQPATLSTEDVDSLNVWNSGDQTYETVTDNAFDSAADLNDGLYVQATSDDARVGFTFDDDVPAGGTQDINPGWNLVGSNFAIDSNAEGPLVSIEDDLTGVDASALDLFRSDFSEFLDPSDQVDAYDAYWAYNPAGEADERGVTSSPYSVDDRRTVLEQGAPFFNVSVDDVELTSIEDADDRGLLEDRDVVGDSEQAVIVTATVDNEGTGHDVQFANLELTSIEQTVQFERVDRTGVDLEPGENETVTLSYIASQDDTSSLDDFFEVDDLAIEVNTEDASATAGAAFDDGGVDLDPQALTSDGEFIVNNVDVAGDGTVELRDANGDVLDSETFTSGINDGVIFDDIDTSSVAVGDELTVQVVDDDNSVLASDDAIVLQSTDVSAVDQESFALVNETVDFNAFIGNNALEPETEDVEFEVELNGEVVANETREGVELGNDGTTETITVDTQAIGAGLNDTVTVTATAVGSGDSDSETRTVAESTLTFNEQALNADGEVLVEDVTADDNQQIVITDTEFTTVGSVDVDTLSGSDSGVNGENVLVDVSGATPGPHIAHVVAEDETVDGEGPNLVNDQANVLSASVDITDTDFDDSSVSEADLPVDVVTSVDVSTSVSDADGDRNSNYTVEIRQGGDVIGESDNLSDAATTTVELDDPVTKEGAFDEELSIDAVLVDQSGAEFSVPTGENLDVDNNPVLTGAFDSASNTETFDVDVTDAEANVALNDQALGSANGADAVFVDDVTAEAGQFVVITAADDNSEILGSTEIESDVAGEDNVIVELGSEIDAGEYRAHIATDAGLATGSDIVSDAGTIFDATLEFNDQDFVGATDKVNVATADLLDGAANDTEFAIAIHPVAENGSVGDSIGEANGLTGENDDVDVSLDEEISEEGEYIAMLHDSPFAPDNAITQVEGDSVVPVTDGATITSVPSQVTFNDQASDGDVVLEDVAAAEDSTVVVTYEDNESLIVAGTTTIDNVTVAGAQNLTVSVAGDLSGFPGDHTAHVIPTDGLSGTYSPGDTVSDATAANITSNDTATVFDTDLTFADEFYEDETSSVTIDAANLSDGAGDATTFGVDVVSDDGNVSGTATGLNGTNTEVEVALNETVTNTTDFTATLTQNGEPVDFAETGGTFSEITDGATVNISSAEGGNLTFSEQAIGTEGGDDVVLVQDLEETTIDNAGQGNVSNPANDFVVLFEGDEVNADNIVAFEPISAADGDSDLTINVSDVDLTPGNHTVEIHADDGTGEPDPAQPRGAAETATVFDGAVNITTEQIDATEEPADEIDVDASLLDGASVAYNVTVSGDASGSVGATGDGPVTVELDSELTDGDTVTAAIEVDGQVVQQAAGGTTFADLDDTQTVSVTDSNFQLNNVNVDGDSPSTTIAEDADPVSVGFTVANNGDADDEANVRLNVTNSDGESIITRERTTFTLAPGDSLSSSFANVDFGALTPGAYTATVETDDDTESIDVSVEGENFAVDDLNVSTQGDTATVREDETFDVTATVENLGNVQGTQDITLNVTDASGADVANATTEVSNLAGGVNETVTFSNLNIDVGTDAESFDVTVSSADDVATGDLTVNPLNFDATINSVSPGSFELGETPVDVGIQISNNADEELTRTYDVTIVDSEGTERVTVSDSRTLGSGDSFTTTETLGTADLEPGDYEVVVSTETDEETQDVTVEFANVSNLDQNVGYDTLENALGNVSDGEELRIDNVDLTNEPTELELSSNGVRLFGQGVANSSVDANLTVSGDNNVGEDFELIGDLTLAGSNNDFNDINTVANSPTGAIFVEGSGNDLSDIDAEGDVVINGENTNVVNTRSTGGSVTVNESVRDTVTFSGSAPDGQAVIDGETGTFATIQDAVDNASADDTVVAGAGTFDESVTIDVDGLTLESIDGETSTITSTGATAVNIAGTDVTVTGFEINATDRGVELDNSANGTTIEENEFKNTGDADIVLNGAAVPLDLSDITVTQNNFEAGSSAIEKATQGAELFTGTLNATNNWWGDASGPSGAGEGSGASVSTDVTFEPFLDAPVPDGESVSTGDFTVSINDDASTTEVTAGENAVINATIENTGDAKQTQTINFTVGETNEGNISVDLAGGASRTVEFTYPTSSGDDDATAEVSSDDASDSRTLTVNDPQTNVAIDSANFSDGNSQSDSVTIVGTFTSTAGELVSSITVGFGNIAGNVGLGNVDAGNVAIDDVGNVEVGNVNIGNNGDDLEVNLSNGIDLSNVDNGTDISITIDDVDTTEATDDGTVSVDFEDDGNTIAGGNTSSGNITTTN